MSKQHAFFDACVMQSWIPDFVFRFFIKQLIHSKWKLESSLFPDHKEKTHAFLKSGPIATQTSASQDQHYCVPTEFYEHVLGKHLKYSSALWGENCHSLSSAEQAMLDTYCDRADLQNGQSILELGCGWGSMTLFMAQRFPNSKIIAMSHSETQKKHIESMCLKLNLQNIEIITEDINTFTTKKRFDRIVSIEMFEHLSNYTTLFENINMWLKPKGKLFVHIFGHARFCYPFLNSSSTDWMSRHFFSGGIMPAQDTFIKFCSPLSLDESWVVNGQHYARTCNAWLSNLHKEYKEILDLFKLTYGKQAKRKLTGWRIFFIACAELFAYKNGSEWAVFHYRFSKS